MQMLFLLIELSKFFENIGTSAKIKLITNKR